MVTDLKNSSISLKIKDIIHYYEGLESLKIQKTNIDNIDCVDCLIQEVKEFVIEALTSYKKDPLYSIFYEMIKHNQSYSIKNMIEQTQKNPDNEIMFSFSEEFLADLSPEAK